MGDWRRRQNAAKQRPNTAITRIAITIALKAYSLTVTSVAVMLKRTYFSFSIVIYFCKKSRKVILRTDDTKSWSNDAVLILYTESWFSRTKSLCLMQGDDMNPTYSLPVWTGWYILPTAKLLPVSKLITTMVTVNRQFTTFCRQERFMSASHSIQP